MADKDKLTPAMVRMLRDVHEHDDPTRSLKGKSEHGGATWTMRALVRKGMLDRHGSITDKGIDWLVRNTKSPEHGMAWRIHAPNLLKEILNNPGTSILRIPLNLFRNFLGRVAQRAAEINDRELNRLMLHMALYADGDPTDNDNYNAEMVANPPGVNAASSGDMLKTLKRMREILESGSPRLFACELKTLVDEAIAKAEHV